MERGVAFDVVVLLPLSRIYLAPTYLRRASDMDQSPPILDLAALERLQDDVGDVQIVRRFMTRFLEVLDDRLERLRAACSEHQAEGLWNVSSGLRVSSTMLGAASLAECCAHLQSVADDGDFAAVECDVIELRDRAVATRTEILGVLHRYQDEPSR